jgi:hypothetical protein
MSHVDLKILRIIPTFDYKNRINVEQINKYKKAGEKGTNRNGKTSDWTKYECIYQGENRHDNSTEHKI